MGTSQEENLMVSEKKAQLYQFIEAMPKVELHVHLEGSMRLATLIELAHKNKRPLPANTPEALQQMLKVADFAQFVQLYKLLIHTLATEDDYERIAYEFCADCAAQNIHYAEVTFTLTLTQGLNGITWHQALAAINRGYARAKKEFTLTIGWILDILREQPETITIIEEALKLPETNIVAVGLTGDEFLPCAPKLIEFFVDLDHRHLPTTIHAGEVGPSTHIWYAIDILKAKRIGHGIACIHDAELVSELVRRQIPLEVCPTSNVSMHSAPSYAEHPLRKMWDEGLFVTINSDDPTFFMTNLTKEYKVLVDHFGFTLDDIKLIALDAIDASFLSHEKKEALEKTFASEFVRLETAYME